MIHWKRVRSGAEWGFFYGVVSWLLATGITNKYTSLAVWAIILSRTIMGIIQGLVQWDMAWWHRSIIIGAIVNILMGLVVGVLGYGWHPWFAALLASGILFAVLIEFSLERRYGEKAEVEAAKE
jgi:hypothetical protein